MSDDFLFGIDEALNSILEENESLKKENKKLHEENERLNNVLNKFKNRLNYAIGREVDLNRTSVFDDPKSAPEVINKVAPGQTEKQEGPVKKEEPKVPAAPAKEERPKPAKPEYGRFPYSANIHCMTKNEFLFDYNIITFTNEENEDVNKAEVMVAPLNTKEKHPPLLIWIVTDDGETYTYTTGTKPNRITVKCGKYELNISGTMTGNNFSSYITHHKTNDTQNIRISIVQQKKGTNGHLFITCEDKEIHILPLDFVNRKNEDYADFVYAVVQNGKVIDSGDNCMTAPFITNSRGQKQELLAKWVDNTCYGIIAEPGTAG